MNLLLLAPDIQELLVLPPVERGRDRLKLADLQKVALEVDWGTQRECAAPRFRNELMWRWRASEAEQNNHYTMWLNVLYLVTMA